MSWVRGGVQLAFVVLVGSDSVAVADGSILVRYVDEGPHAVEMCGSDLYRARDHVHGTADRSDSLDALMTRFAVQRVRPLMPARGEPGLEARRTELERRLRSTIADRRRVAPVARSASAEAAEAAAARSLRSFAHVYRIELAEDVDAEEAASAFASDPHVAWSQVDRTNVLDEFGPDPYLDSTGAWGQPYGDLWGLHRIRAPEAWSRSRGDEIVVAVVDSGLDRHHPDIADNVFVHPGEDLNGNGRPDEHEWNGIDDDGNGFIDDLVGFDFANSVDANGDGDYDDPGDVSDPDPFDDKGHGTHVAGTIAAVSGNAIGIAGVAPRARIMALKGFKATGGGSDATLWRAVIYAALNGADIVNNSWSCAQACPRNPLAEEVVRLVHALGVVIVTSAGNRQRDVVSFSPENMWQTITVGSSTVQDTFSSSFTNQGWLVDVLAPGGGPIDTPGVYVPRRNVLSLATSELSAAEEPFRVGDAYLRFSGTSMSAPHVAGVIALLRAAAPELGPDELRRAIRVSAHDLGEPGFDWAHGAGRVDAVAALDALPLPEMRLRVDTPRAGDWFHREDGDIVVGGSIEGEDFDRLEVFVGAGREPSAWLPISESTRVVEEGELARWRVAEAHDGIFVIRVIAHARDGRHYVEHVPISLESRRLTLISEPSDAPAERPAISGRRVIWQSRRGEGEDAFGRADYDLFMARFGSRASRRIVDGAGDQTWASVSGTGRAATLSWLHQAPGAPWPTPAACRFDPHVPCAPTLLAPQETLTTPPPALGNRVYWVDSSSGRLDLHACRFDRPGGPCHRIETGLAPARRGALDGDARSTLVWAALDERQRIAHCTVGSDGTCLERKLPEGVASYGRPGASGDLVAWIAVRFVGDRPLLACVAGPNDWDCDPIEIEPHATDDRIRVSGDLLVWEGARDDLAGDVYFCEFDRLRGECPVQRLTSELSVQRDAAVDGRRIVWSDERFGPGRIVGTRLPAWLPLPPPSRSGANPRRFVTWLDPAGLELDRVHVEFSGHAGIEAPLARARPIGRRGGLIRVLVETCPIHDEIDALPVLTLTAHMTNGLDTRVSMTVSEQRAHHPWSRRAGFCRPAH